MNFKRPLSALALALLLNASASAALLLDTGTPTNDPNNDPPWTLSGGLQWLAGGFTLNDNSLITGIEGWMGLGAGDVTMAIYSDSGNLPGNKLYSAVFHADQDFDWYGLDNLDWLLSTGNYWVAFEVGPNLSYSGGMTGGAPNPMAREAINPISYGTGWEQYGPMNLGVRITGSTSTTTVPEPGPLALLGIGALGLLAQRRRRPAD